MDDLELANAMAAALAERTEAVAGAAFLMLLADAIKARAVDQKARAIRLSEQHAVERTTGKHKGVEVGKLAQNRESVQWTCVGMEPGGELYEWIERHHPAWIDVHPEETVTQTFPERRMVNNARMAEFCETLGADLVDPVTQERVPGLLRDVKAGSWVLTKDRAAKALVAKAVAAMMEKGLPGLAEIEGGK